MRRRVRGEGPGSSAFVPADGGIIEFSLFMPYVVAFFMLCVCREKIFSWRKT